MERKERITSALTDRGDEFTADRTSLILHCLLTLDGVADKLTSLIDVPMNKDEDK